MDHIYYIPYSIKTVYREPVDIESSENGRYHPLDLLPRMIWIRIMSKLRIRDVLNMSEMNSSIVRVSQLYETVPKISRNLGENVENHLKNNWPTKIISGKNFTNETSNRILILLKT